MAVPQKSLLEQLFAPCPAAKFLGEYWPDKPFVAHGDAARLPEYLRSDALRRFHNLSERYHGAVAFGNATTANGMAMAHDVPAVLLRKMGLSLYLPDIARYVPGTEEFLRRLEQELGAEAGVARIGAFAAAVHNGVTSHFDAEEVISVQLEGEKRFDIAPMNEIRHPWGMQYGPDYEPFDDLYPQMDSGIPKVNEDAFEHVEMRPGSVLFMPRGTWHRTQATAESLSVSIIVRQPAAFERVLDQLKLTLLRTPDWRRPLYGASRMTSEARAHVQSLLEDLPQAGQALRAEDVLEGFMSDPARLARLDKTSWLQRVPNAHMLLKPHPDKPGLWNATVRIQHPDAREREIVKLETPLAMLPVFQWLATEERPMRADAMEKRFPDLPFAQIKTILEVLVRAGYLKLLRHVPRMAQS
jgi:ribosomal protein L16 Arg81 hydroxylase